MYRYSSGQVECYQREDYLDSVYVLWKMEYLKFKNLTFHVFYEWFGLRFTGAGLPSHVTTDSAKHGYQHKYMEMKANLSTLHADDFGSLNLHF